jgi:histidine triad (HIT) family protein
VPNKHYQTLYDLPDKIGHRIFETAKKMSIAIKNAYQCDGVTLRQNNEPAGDQHALHYHLHIFPRYEGDSFNQDLAKKSALSKPEDRRVYADKLKHYLLNNGSEV